MNREDILSGVSGIIAEGRNASASTMSFPTVDFSAFMTKLFLVPSYAFAHWDMWFAFAATDYVGEMVAQAVPRSGGAAGMIINSAIGGGLKALDFGVFTQFG
jgi:hypothetical protein